MNPPFEDDRVYAVPGRLNVELRVAALVGLLWPIAVLHAVVWVAVGLAPDELARIPTLRLLLPQLLSGLALLGLLYTRFPAARWSRSESLNRLPSPAFIMVVGVLASPLYVILTVRDRVHRARRPDPDEVEVAFRQLLRLPLGVGTAFVAWLGVAFVADIIILADALDWPTGRSVATALMAVAIATPYSAIVASRTRAMLRPEYLSAPRPRPDLVAVHGDVRVNLGLPTSGAILGAVLVPLVGSWLWLATSVRAETESAADALAGEIIAASESDDPKRIEAALVLHPEARLVDRRTATAAVNATLPEGDGPFDADGDGRIDALARSSPAITVVVPLTDTPLSPLALALALASALAAGLATVWSASAAVRRDVLRATEQVHEVARGRPAPKLSEGDFLVLELRKLLKSVDRLVSRITETNVARYVAIEKAQEADRLKSQFLANMSHDLRSPLNSILGFSELLLTGIEGELIEEQRGMVRTIHDSGRELLQQIDDILDTAKIEAGRMELHPEPTPVATLISRAIQAARKRVGDKIEFETKIAVAPPPAFVDPYRTVQALENVLVFAAEKLEEGCITVEVLVEKSEAGRMMKFVVHTPVSPATAEQLRVILRGFVRIPGHAGLGLGLPIAGSILELQGGSLGIEDQGAGSVFTVRMPAPETRRRLRLETS